MTPEMKQSLEQVVVAMANEQTADAKAAFSQYLRMKTRSILLGEKEEDMDDEKDEDCDDEDDADEGDDDKKSKKGKKDDKDDEKDED